MKASDVLMDFIFGICFPTVDVYTDIALIYRYTFIPKCKDAGFDIGASKLSKLQLHSLLHFNQSELKLTRNNFNVSEAVILVTNFIEEQKNNGTIFNSCKEMGTSPKFGLLMLCPIIISTIFIFGQWLRLENSPKKRLYTFPLLLLQIYPQYRTLKVLYMALWKRDIRWKKDKQILERNLKSIGRISNIKILQNAAC